MFNNKRIWFQINDHFYEKAKYIAQMRMRRYIYREMFSRADFQRYLFEFNDLFALQVGEVVASVDVISEYLYLGLLGDFSDEIFYVFEFKARNVVCIAIFE